jgi:hypothetical protein
MDVSLMNDFNDFLIPYAVSNLIGLLLLWLNWKRPRAGLIVFGMIFLLAGIFNFYTASTTPEDYQQYASWAIINFYVEFITGFFRDHAEVIVKVIAMGQILIGALLLTKKGRMKLPAVIGGILFFIAIAPLGLGSALPATLIMALGLFMGYKRSVDHRPDKIT